MESIKNALHIGKHKDEGVTAGTGSDAAPQRDAGSGSFNAGVPTGTANAPELYTLPSEEKKEHGVMRQILNPGGEKYSDLSYGQTATTDSTREGVVDHNSSTEQKPKEHGILKQIFNPGNDKYDADNFKGSDDVLAAGPVSDGQRIPGALATGSAAQPVESTEAAHDNRGVLRQLVNPGGEKYDEMRYAPTGNVVTGTQQPHEPVQPDNASALSIKSGLHGPYAGATDNVITGSSTTAPSTTTTTAPTHESHVGRDAALGAGAGAVAYEAQKGHHQDDLSSRQTTGAQALPDRSAASAPQQTTSSTSATSGAPYGATQTTSSTPATYTSSAPQQTSGAAQTYGTPSAVSSQTQGNTTSYGSTQPTSQSHRGEEAAALGAAGVGAAGLAAHEHNKHNTATSTSAGQGYNTGSTYPSTQSQGTSGGPSLTSGTAYDRSQPLASNPSGRNDRGLEAAALGSGAAGGYAASQSASQPTSGLTHHVHNGLTEPLPASSSHHDHTTPRILSVQEGTGSAAKPVHHPHGPSYNIPSAYEDGHSAKVYNTVTGRHSVEDSEVPHSEHDSSLGRDAGLAAGAGTGALAGAALGSSAGRDTSRSGPTGTGSGLGASTPGSSAQPTSQTSSQAPGYQTSSQASGYQTSAQAPGYTSSGIASSTPAGYQTSSTGAQTGYPTSSSQAPTTGAGYQGTSTQPTSGHDHSTSQTGGTAAAALAAQEAMRRHENQQTGLPSSYGAGATSQSGQSEHHYGRDAALAGGAGAAGYGAYEAGKHGTSGTASHASNVDPTTQSSSQQSGQAQHHYGRDAALAGGAGAVGYGAYEAGRHETSGTGSHASNVDTTAQSGSQQSSSTTGPHKSALLNKLDPRVKSDSTKTDSTKTEPTHADQSSHTGRDAAIGAGAGFATGGTIYEAEKHHHSQQPTSSSQQYGSSQPTSSSQQYGSSQPTSSSQQYGSSQPTSTQTTTTTNTTTSTSGPHSSSLLNKLDPRIGSDQWQPQSEHSHTGRDAALAGGAGAATGAAVGRAEQPHVSGTSHTGYGSEQTSGSYAGYGSSDTTPHKSGLLNKLDPRTSSEPTQQQSQQQSQSSHLGRDTALAGGAGAATGAGIYEAERHHGQSAGYGQTSSNVPGQAATTGSQSGYAQSGAPASQQTYNQSAVPASQQGYDQSTSQPGSGSAYSGSTTTGAHRSETLNKLDPRVKQDTTQDQSQGHSHEGRDLAAGAGVGAATGAAIEHHDDKKQSRPLVREDEHHHNKLHKEPKEKKEGFLHKLLHPHHKKDKESELDSPTGSEQRYQQEHGAAATGAQGSNIPGEQSNMPTDPTTGLPINVEKYGSGAGGTDGSQNISGYQAGSGTHAADWQDISKKNTPY